MIRPLLSLKRSSFDEKDGKVCYQYRNSLKQERMDYLEFIARVTSHIPDKGQVMIRYYGLYANAYKGKKRKSGEDNNLPFSFFHKLPCDSTLSSSFSLIDYKFSL